MNLDANITWGTLYAISQSVIGPQPLNHLRPRDARRVKSRLPLTPPTVHSTPCLISSSHYTDKHSLTQKIPASCCGKTLTELILSGAMSSTIARSNLLHPYTKTSIIPFASTSIRSLLQPTSPSSSSNNGLSTDFEVGSR